MKIISKRQAMAIYRQHSESRLFRFCTGKYKWYGSICHYHGRDVQDTLGSCGYLYIVIYPTSATTA
ncbi:DUF987 family protein [Phytobacter diazotrophicus]|uniref:DUF987 family protein n=1 Tax=Phytobacter diazotrophicus TaxID=395631 RepID=UPI003AF04D0C